MNSIKDKISSAYLNFYEEIVIICTNKTAPNAATDGNPTWNCQKNVHPAKTGNGTSKLTPQDQIPRTTLGT